MKKILLLIPILVLALIFGCGGGSTQAPEQNFQSPTGSEPTNASTNSGIASSTIGINVIYIGSPVEKNWDADPEMDGIAFYLVPKDIKSYVVMPTAGTLSAELWLEKSMFEGQGKGNLVQKWENIQVLKADYDPASGAEIHLEYNGSQPKELKLGTLEVTFTTADGQVLNARATAVILGN
jgi:hypothetical protein